VKHSGQLAFNESFFHVNLPARDETPSRVRRTLGEILSEFQLEQDDADVVLLLACELVTNAVRFGSNSPGLLGYPGAADAARIAATLWHRPGLLTIEVSDHSMNPPILRGASTDEERGRGLILVDALCKSWGYYYARPGSKTVYCDLDVGHSREGITVDPIQRGCPDAVIC
jgi:anti-sigma regulatory factor (Ser/Thr protein kinase)